jgi:hypothetical protein
VWPTWLPPSPTSWRAPRGSRQKRDVPRFMWSSSGRDCGELTGDHSSTARRNANRHAATSEWWCARASHESRAWNSISLGALRP